METVNTDILVIGGGVNGTSIAMALAGRNVGKITLIEKVKYFRIIDVHVHSV